MMIYPHADVYLRLAFMKLIGVTVPKLNIYVQNATSAEYTGLSRGGLAVLEARQKFQFALRQLTHYASVEYTVKVMLEGIRVNNMRVNGMEFVLIPRYQNTLKYIAEEIDEYSRQDFYRLKRWRAKRLEKVKLDIADMRMKRDRPEEYKQKETDNNKRRYSLPHWRSILTPKVNVDFARKNLVRTPRKLFKKDPKFNTFETFEDKFGDIDKMEELEEYDLEEHLYESDYVTESISEEINSENIIFDGSNSDEAEENEDDKRNSSNLENLINVSEYSENEDNDDV